MQRFAQLTKMTWNPSVCIGAQVAEILDRGLVDALGRIVLCTRFSIVVRHLIVFPLSNLLAYLMSAFAIRISILMQNIIYLD